MTPKQRETVSRIADELSELQLELDAQKEVNEGLLGIAHCIEAGEFDDENVQTTDDLIDQAARALDKANSWDILGQNAWIGRDRKLYTVTVQASVAEIDPEWACEKIATEWLADINNQNEVKDSSAGKWNQVNLMWQYLATHGWVCGCGCKKKKFMSGVDIHDPNAKEVFGCSRCDIRLRRDS